MLVRSKNPSAVIINHERIHLQQQLELLIVFFYVWYVSEWIYYYFKFGNWWAAYHAIRFEKEAYANEKDLNYLKNRAFWGFSAY